MPIDRYPTSEEIHMADPTRRSRAFTVAAATTVLGLVLAGPVGAQSPEAGPLFVAINKSADQQYFIDLQTAFKAKIEELGGTALTYDAKLDPNLGVSLVNDAISAGAKGIAITVPDQTIGPAVAKAATEAGVALVATDDNITDEAGAPVPFVGFNGTDMGTKVGQAAADLLTAGGWLEDAAIKVGVLSTEVQTLSVCEDRTNASKQAMLDAGVPAENIFQVPYTGETQSAQDAAGPVITAHPDVTHWVVFACNDEGVLGTLNALATAGVSPDNVLGVGLGAYEACKPWAAGQPSGFKAALFISGLDVGASAAQVLWDNVVNGVALPEFTIAPTTIVDAATFATTMDPVSVANCGG
jgi:L-arabinose transport system substrate-binding protein